MLHDEVNAFRLFKEAKSGLQIIKYFSQRHGLHLHVRTRVGVLRGCMFQNPFWGAGYHDPLSRRSLSKQPIFETISTHRAFSFRSTV